MTMIMTSRDRTCSTSFELGFEDRLVIRFNLTDLLFDMLYFSQESFHQLLIFFAIFYIIMLDMNIMLVMYILLLMLILICIWILIISLPVLIFLLIFKIPNHSLKMSNLSQNFFIGLIIIFLDFINFADILQFIDNFL